MPNQHLPDNDPMKNKKTGKWTKYGGAIYGLIKEQITSTWYCQMCGEEIPKELPPFNYEMYPGEFIRICNRCQSLASRTITIHRIIRIVRHKRD